MTQEEWQRLQAQLRQQEQLRQYAQATAQQQAAMADALKYQSGLSQGIGAQAVAESPPVRLIRTIENGQEIFVPAERPR